MLIDFRALRVRANLAIFGAAAVVAWVGGARLAYYADAISDRLNLSKEFVGLILLGVAADAPTDERAGGSGRRLGAGCRSGGRYFLQ